MCFTFCTLCCLSAIDVDSMTDAFEKSKKSNDPNKTEARNNADGGSTNYSETDSLLKKPADKPNMGLRGRVPQPPDKQVSSAYAAGSSPRLSSNKIDNID